jgi:hypothetical protein
MDEPASASVEDEKPLSKDLVESKVSFTPMLML